MAQVTRIKVTQPDGETKEPVAFLSDIKLNTVDEGNLIKVTTNNKTATVSVDSNILSIDGDNVKVNKPLEFQAQTTTPTETTGLRAVIDGSETKLYWGSNVIESHDPGEGYVKTTTFNNTIELIEDDITVLEGVTAGYTTENTIKNAVDAVDAKADNIIDGVIGAWRTIRDTTVKRAIEDAEEAIEVNTAEIAALKGNHFIVVNELPATGEPNCIYLIPKDGTEARNIKEEWIYVNNDWEKIGDTAVDLTDYAKTADVQTLVSNEATTRDAADTALGTRLTTVEGKLGNATGDNNIDVAASGTALSVAVKANSTLAKILEVCEIDSEEE